MNLPHFPIFDTTQVDTLPQRWKTYKKCFEILCNAIGANNKKKLSALLKYVGEKMYGIYEQIVLQGITTQTSSDFLTEFKTHIEPSVSYI